MDKRLAHAAKTLANNDTFNEATDIVLGLFVKDLLAAKTPEDRERKFQEYEALRRVREVLGKLALEADK